MSNPQPLIRPLSMPEEIPVTLGHLNVHAPDFLDRLQAAEAGWTPHVTEYLGALRAALTPEQTESVLYPLLNALQAAARLQGAIKVEQQRRKMTNRLKNDSASDAYSLSLQKTITSMDKQVKNLERQLQASRAMTAPAPQKAAPLPSHRLPSPRLPSPRLPSPTLSSPTLPTRKSAPTAPPAPAPWTPPIVVPARRLCRNEVLTDTPEQIRRVARWVLDFVRGSPNFRCQKPDVSAHLPRGDRPYLATAYRHLHVTNQVHVDGWHLRAVQLPTKRA